MCHPTKQLNGKLNFMGFPRMIDRGRDPHVSRVTMPSTTSTKRCVLIVRIGTPHTVD